MRNFLRCLLVAVLAIAIQSNPAYSSSTEAKRTLVKFQEYLAKAERDYRNTYTKAKSDFDSTLSSKESLIRKAQQDFLNSNQVRVLKLGDNRNYWGSFNCPITRPNCIYVDKGPKFEVGEITSIKGTIADKVANLDEIELILNLGLIELLTPKEYLSATKIIREETLAIATLRKEFQNDSLLIQQEYEQALLVEPAILAIKRAGKSPGNFQKAFVTALRFEYNRARLDEIARLPFRYIDSLKALDSAVKVTKLSEDADDVAASYSLAGAARINKICGKTFITESKFRELFSEISNVYRDLTGKRL